MIQGQVSPQPKSCFDGIHLGAAALVDRLHTLWLFVTIDLHSCVYPCTAFAALTSLSGLATTSNPPPDLKTVLLNCPIVMIWVWFNLLIFTISNQRLPKNILEDQLNKSWRPLPAKRISPDGARKVLLMFAIPATFAISFLIGTALEEVWVAVVLQYLYNDLEGGNEIWLIRNLLSSALLATYDHGSLRILSHTLGHQLNPAGHQWILIIWIIAFLTGPLADFSDQSGDQEINRRTLPLVCGDTVARYLMSFILLGVSHLRVETFGSRDSLAHEQGIDM